jgi:purine-binding chemotaxis protein CheW
MDNEILTEKQLVVFDLGEESYAVDIAVVREIIQMQPITRVPGLPKSIIGVIDIRGSVVPVIDLRLRLKMNKIEPDSETRIIIVNSTKHEIGIIVDSVSKVLKVPEGSFESSSDLFQKDKNEYLSGIAKINNKLIIVLDMNHILTNEESININNLNLNELKENIHSAGQLV